MAAPAPTWRNRIVGHADVDPADLLANPRNFRRHPKPQQDALSGAIGEIGFIDPVIVQQGTDMVIDGHLRVEMAMRQGVSTIPVQYVDLTDAEANLALATIDPISAMAYHDQDQLDALLADLSPESDALQAMLDELRTEPELTEGLTDPDDVPGVPDEPVTKPGDLWLLGRHRLLCGDATDPLQIDRLLSGETADVVCTDPPYGINAVTGKKGQWGGIAERYRPIEGDQTSDVAKDVFRLISAMGIRVQIWWGANHYCSVVPDSSCWIVWYKRDGNDGNDFADCELAWTNQPSPARLIQHQWNGFLKASEKGEVRTHPTQKPVALSEFCLNEYSQPNDLVLDLFGGSGSTLIACEQTGRRCAMMELDPHYCDVIIRRFEQFTGQTATLATDAMAAD